MSTISALSRSTSGRSSGSSAASSTTAKFGRVWEATWPRESPVTSASAPSRRPSAEATFTINRRCESTWSRPEAHDEEPRVALEAVQSAHERVGLVDRLRAGERAAAEMHEVAAEAALHHPVGSDRGVEPAREEHHRPTARANGQAARPPQALAGHQQLAVVHFHVHRHVRMREIDLKAETHPH